jgi:hypothetical protein
VIQLVFLRLTDGVEAGIGTYVSNSELMNSSADGGLFTKFKSNIQKANDQMFGDSFADHVVAGYKFLMVCTVLLAGAEEHPR